ncbi:hypothetical protein K8R03_04255 [Candidatus Kaiserbacteria bacterium]|nr:hypothetical protein [Candidatus Kaiserbacteria bacterium]
MKGMETPRQSDFRRESIEGPLDSAVSFSPERGGIITSLRLAGTEVLYMEEDTFKDPSKNVRGGIPLLFPNSGPVEHELFPGLKQHGFARTMNSWKSMPTGGKPQFAERLSDTDATREQYPYPFTLEVGGSLEEDGTFLMYQRATNTAGTDSAMHMPVAMGLHPYFRVAAAEKENISFQFTGGDVITRDVRVWAKEGGTVSVDNPGTSMPVHIPSIGTLVLTASPEYRKVWIWSLPDKDFICIEPVMRDEGGLVRDPAYVEPGESLTGRFSIRLEK